MVRACWLLAGTIGWNGSLILIYSIGRDVLYIDIVDDTDLLLESRSLSGRQIFE